MTHDMWGTWVCRFGLWAFSFKSVQPCIRLDIQGSSAFSNNCSRATCGMGCKLELYCCCAKVELVFHLALVLGVVAFPSICLLLGFGLGWLVSVGCACRGLCPRPGDWASMCNAFQKEHTTEKLLLSAWGLKLCSARVRYKCWQG